MKTKDQITEQVVTKMLTGQEAKHQIKDMTRRVVKHLRIASAWAPKTMGKEVVFTPDILEGVRRGDIIVTLLCRFGSEFDIGCNGPMLDWLRSLNLPGIQIYIGRTCHSKTVIADESEILCGSANLTGSGLDSEEFREQCCYTTDRSAVLKGIADFNKLLNDAVRLPHGDVAVVRVSTVSGYSLLSPISTKKISTTEEDKLRYPGSPRDFGIDLKKWAIGRTVTIERPDYTPGGHPTMPLLSSGKIIDVISQTCTSRLDQELLIKSMHGSSYGGGPLLAAAALGVLDERKAYVLVKWDTAGDLFSLANPSEFVQLTPEEE